MCGITGVLSFNMVGRIHLIHLEAATRKLEKRGPDVHKTWFDDHVGLGHRRLSIIDPSPESNQPFHDESGRYILVFNGEIYNYREIRSRLKGHGVSFQTNSDTEVILKSYIHSGVDCVKDFNGFFAFAIYDKHDKSIFLARDRFGIKPLLYFKDDDKFVFASELKSLLTYKIKKELNEAALHQYFQLTYVPDQTSILNGVSKLQPGHTALVKDGQLTIKPFYQTVINSQLETNLSSANNRIIDLMTQSVERRMVSDVPLGAFLSGGIDSSIIVALASSMTSSLKTFSVGFKENKYFDETHYAEIVANRFKTDHTVFKLGNDDLLEHVQDIVEYIDEPFADSSAIPVYILSKLTRDKVKVALSGDGADEVFSGYNKHSAWYLSQQENSFNNFVSATAWIWKVMPKSRYSKLTDRFRQLDKYAQLLSLDHREKYWHLASFISKIKVKKLLKNTQFETSEKEIQSLLSDFQGHDLNEVLLKDLQLVLPGDMLRKVDLMSMANGLEVRVPFLDHEVVDFAFSLDSKLKLVGKSRKILLREAFRDQLPEVLYSRPKHGFEVPIMDWFKKELKSEINDFVFNRDRVEAQQLFDWKEVKRIKKRLYSFDPSDAHIQTWSLYVFQKWYSRYFDT